MKRYVVFHPNHNTGMMVGASNAVQAQELADEVLNHLSAKDPSLVGHFSFTSDSFIARQISMLRSLNGPSSYDQWVKEPLNDTAPDDPVNAGEFLQVAMETIAARGETYDKPGGVERSMGRTVAAFEQITGVKMTETQGWLFMATLKAVRSEQNQRKADNYLDGAAYFALAGESATNE